MKSGIGIAIAAILSGYSAVLAAEEPKGFGGLYRLTRFEFTSGEQVVLVAESKLFVPKRRYDITDKLVTKETINISFIPDTVLSQESQSKEWVRGPQFKLGRLKPGTYILRITQFPKCHRDPQPCTGAMWISPVIQGEIIVR